MGSVAALPFLSLARSLGSISLVCKLLRTNGTGFYEPEMENWVGHKATAAAATALLSPWSAVGLGATIIYGQGVQIFESFRGTTTERRGTVEHLRSAIRARDARERARTPFHFARIIPPLHIKEERDHAPLGGRRAKQGQNENEPLPLPPRSATRAIPLELRLRIKTEDKREVRRKKQKRNAPLTSDDVFLCAQI